MTTLTSYDPVGQTLTVTGKILINFVKVRFERKCHITLGRRELSEIVPQNYKKSKQECAIDFSSEVKFQLIPKITKLRL